MSKYLHRKHIELKYSAVREPSATDSTPVTLGSDDNTVSDMPPQRYLRASEPESEIEGSSDHGESLQLEEAADTHNDRHCNNNMDAEDSNVSLANSYSTMNLTLITKLIIVSCMANLATKIDNYFNVSNIERCNEMDTLSMSLNMQYSI